MKIFYLLVADTGWAKLYRCDDGPEEPTLIYHQRNLPGTHCHPPESLPAAVPDMPSAISEAEDLARGLCKLLKSHFQAGKFDAVVVFGSGDFIETIHRHIDSKCRDLMLDEVVPNPGLLTPRGLRTSLQHLV